MSEHEPNPEEYGDSDIDLKIPPEFRIPSDKDIETKLKTRNEGNEEEREIKNLAPYRLFITPNRIASRIREIKREVFNPEIKPGIERKEELLAEYEVLKRQRERTRQQIMDQIHKNKENIDDFVARGQQRLKHLEESHEEAMRYGDKEKAQNILGTWQEHRDYMFLLQNDPADISLQDEDEGFALK